METLFELTFQDQTLNPQVGTFTDASQTTGTFNANQAAPETIDIPAPGDGTLTIQLNGTDVQTFTANQSGNATANIVTPAVNDGTLTIMVDGITAGTFTANQSTDTIVALTSGGGGGSADVQPMSKSIAHSIAASVFGA